MREVNIRENLSLTLVVGDLEGGKVPEDLVWRGILPDPVLILDDPPVLEPHLGLAAGRGGQVAGVVIVVVVIGL